MTKSREQLGADSSDVARFGNSGMGNTSAGNLRVLHLKAEDHHRNILARLSDGYLASRTGVLPTFGLAPITQNSDSLIQRFPCPIRPKS